MVVSTKRSTIVIFFLYRHMIKSGSRDRMLSTANTIFHVGLLVFFCENKAAMLTFYKVNKTR